MRGRFEIWKQALTVNVSIGRHIGKREDAWSKVAGNMADGGIFAFDTCFGHLLRTSRLVLFILSQFTCLHYLDGLRVLLFCFFCHVLRPTDTVTKIWKA